MRVVNACVTAAIVAGLLFATRNAVRAVPAGVSDRDLFKIETTVDWLAHECPHEEGQRRCADLRSFVRGELVARLSGWQAQGATLKPTDHMKRKRLEALIYWAQAQMKRLEAQGQAVGR